MPSDGQPVDELDPAKPFAGHFDQSDMAPPGSISMPGYHGANVQNVQIRMMVDELLGARHQLDLRHGQARLYLDELVVHGGRRQRRLRRPRRRAQREGTP